WLCRGYSGLHRYTRRYSCRPPIMDSAILYMHIHWLRIAFEIKRILQPLFQAQAHIPSQPVIDMDKSK
ncbi:MAG: hypothetical protein IJG56_04515, partial [Clostridia bacterium]|nr:hypothetical protein [Clostridia bacterium]